jgi:hypothetical protein
MLVTRHSLRNWKRESPREEIEHEKGSPRVNVFNVILTRNGSPISPDLTTFDLSVRVFVQDEVCVVLLPTIEELTTCRRLARKNRHNLPDVAEEGCEMCH